MQPTEERLLYKKVLQDLLRGDPSNVLDLSVQYGKPGGPGTYENGKYVMHFSTPYFCVLEISRIGSIGTVSYESYNWMPSREDLELVRLVQLAFSSMLEEEYFASYLPINNQMNYLINFQTFETQDEPGESLRYTNHLKDILTDTCLCLEETEGIHLGATVSSVCRGWENLPALFREARRLTSYQRTLDYATRVITYFDVADLYQPLAEKNRKKDLEHKYLMNVMSGNYIEACDMLMEILNFYQQDSLPSVSSFSHQVMSLVSFALRTQFIDIYSDDYDEYGILVCAKELQLTNSLSEARPLVRRLYAMLAEAVEDQTSQDNVRVEAALSCLEKRFRDPNLTIVSLSEALGISAQHLTKLLRQNTGMSALEAIHNRRIQEAKHLLADTNMTVKNILIACGYDNQWTFFRTFKKYEGITPGEYRILAKAEHA